MSVSIFAPVASATVKPKPPGIGSTIKVAAIPGASGAYSVTVLQVYSNYIYDRAPYRLTENGQSLQRLKHHIRSLLAWMHRSVMGEPPGAPKSRGVGRDNGSVGLAAGDAYRALW